MMGGYSRFYGGGGFDRFGGNGTFSVLGNKGSWLPILIGGIFELAIFAVIFYLIYRIIKNKNQFNYGKTDTAMELLKLRLAKGEIDSEEFNHKKEHLS